MATQEGEKAECSLQFRLHEKDGKIELCFREEKAPATNSNGFNTSLQGWDANDVFVATAQSMVEDAKLSTFKKAYMLDSESYIHWTATGDLVEQRYTFTPCLDTTAPANAPRNLKVAQEGSDLLIQLAKAPGADATIVLVSESPITSADLPSDGETFLAANDMMFGNAHAIYYGTDTRISLTYPDIKPSQDYYIQAISANGYPAYNVENPAEVVFSTSQKAPESLYARAAGTKSIRVNVTSKLPVIVAMTNEVLGGYQKGYAGTFGAPTADVAVGDEIEGGGKVIYVGEPQEIIVDCEPNAMTYFRAWTVNGDNVSKTAVDAYAVPEVSLPYAPQIENYPFGSLIHGWTGFPTNEEFSPWVRGYYGDNAVFTVIDSQERRLTTPALPLNTPFNVSFEFAMETQRDPAATPDSNGVELPQGCEPGWFGAGGYLRVRTGNVIHKTITSYEGTMEGFDTAGYNDFSSTFVPVSVDVPAQSEYATVTLAMCSQKASRFFIRNFVITPIEKAPEAPKDLPTDVNITEDADGLMYLDAKRGEDAVMTMVLFSEQPMTDAELPADGHIYTVGETVGKAKVLYFGNDEVVNCSTTYSYNGEMQFIFADFDTDYYLRLLSASDSPLFNRDNVLDITYHSNPDPNAGSGVEQIAAEGAFEVYTPTGVRVPVKNFQELPAGLYIVNGRKYIKR